MPADLNQTLLAAVEQARPLAARHGVSLSATPATEPSAVAVHELALRHVLLSLISAAIRCAPGGTVALSVTPLTEDVEIGVRALGPCSTGDVSPSIEETTSLDVAYELAELCRGWLATATAEGEFNARLVIPALGRMPVLVIDDNVDTLQLLRRYASGSRYHLVATSEPQQALGLAEQVSPRIIVLDVMMPRTDGWEFLALLRQHPLTSHIPVVICTILAQEEMALALGASGFVRKPVTRQEFLAALDQQVELDRQTGLRKSRPG
jgi:CheY-like chemotaxis protein